MFKTIGRSARAALASRHGAMAGAALAITTAALVGATSHSGAQTPTAAAGTGAAAADVFTPEQRKGIESIVRDYLIKNPEILLEVSKELEERQQAQQSAIQQKVIVERKASIFRAPTDFVLGNPDGNITVVEFFDYNCGWCKRAVDELTKIIKADPNVRIVMKELPIFGENSTIAAKAAMASIAQGKYWDFHVALMKERQVTKDNVYRIAEKVGLDVARLKKDMENPKFDAALKETMGLAQALGIEGTPGFIVDTKVNVGFLAADGLNDLIAEVRKSGCKIC